MISSCRLNGKFKTGLILSSSCTKQCKMTAFPWFWCFYKGHKMLAQCRAKGNEDLICNLLLVTPEGCCRPHQLSCLVFLLNSRNKCYKFVLDFTIFSIPFAIGWSWAEVYLARCYCRVLACWKVEVSKNRNIFALNYDNVLLSSVLS